MARLTKSLHRRLTTLIDRQTRNTLATDGGYVRKMAYKVQQPEAAAYIAAQPMAACKITLDTAVLHFTTDFNNG